jgi:hypothetical protein
MEHAHQKIFLTSGQFCNTLCKIIHISLNFQCKMLKINQFGSFNAEILQFKMLFIEQSYPRAFCDV